MAKKCKPSPKVELYADKKGEYRWRLKSSNGKIVCDSAEGYKTRRAALHGATVTAEAFKGEFVWDDQTGAK